MDGREILSRNRRKIRGLRGMLPLRCLPLWGREGVTLIGFIKKYVVTGFQQSRINIFNLLFVALFHNSEHKLRFMLFSRKSKFIVLIFSSRADFVKPFVFSGLQNLLPA